MKRKQLLLSLSLAAMVLFSILFQSMHSYEHIVKQLSEKQCHHDYNDRHGEITHQHHNFDSCFICHFAFTSYLAPQEVVFQFRVLHKEIPYFFTFSEKLLSFSKSAYLLRGPPTALVS